MYPLYPGWYPGCPPYSLYSCSMTRCCISYCGPRIGISALRPPTGIDPVGFFSDPRRGGSFLFCSISLSFSTRSLSFSAFNRSSFSFCSFSLCSFSLSFSFSFCSFSLSLSAAPSLFAFAPPPGVVVGLLLITPRYQNMRLLIRTCSYSGLRGLASLMWLSLYIARSTWIGYRAYEFAGESGDVGGTYDLDAPRRACAASRPAVGLAISGGSSTFAFLEPPKSVLRNPPSLSLSARSRFSRSRSRSLVGFFAAPLPPHFPKIPPFLSLSFRCCPGLVGDVYVEEDSWGGESDTWLADAADGSSGEGVRGPCCSGCEGGTRYL